MTIQMTEADVMAIAEGLAWAGSIVAVLIIALLVYLMVRPPRRRSLPVEPDAEAIDMRELVRLMDRMEQRLEVLERLVTDEKRDREQLLEADEGPQTRRTK